MPSMEQYREAIEKRVAAACMDRTDDGKCNPPEGRVCALEFDIPAVIQAVRAVRSNRIDEYSDSIRNVVCVHCVNRDEHGECYFRDHMECCLDNFLSLVVDAVEELENKGTEVSGSKN